MIVSSFFDYLLGLIEAFIKNDTQSNSNCLFSMIFKCHCFKHLLHIQAKVDLAFPFVKDKT